MKKHTTALGLTSLLVTAVVIGSVGSASSAAKGFKSEIQAGEIIAAGSGQPSIGGIMIASTYIGDQANFQRRHQKIKISGMIIERQHGSYTSVKRISRIDSVGAEIISSARIPTRRENIDHAGVDIPVTHIIAV